MEIEYKYTTNFHRNQNCKLFEGRSSVFTHLGISTVVTGDYHTASPMVSINICSIELLTNACKNKQDLHALLLMNRIKITHVIHQIN